ncbi:MAG: hypothetical protein AB4058_20360 [Microcystaceae cyanobacterium]
MAVTLSLRQLTIPQGQTLLIHNFNYQQVTTSPIFPRLSIPDLVTEVLAQSSEIGRSPALRALRQKLKQLL